MDPKTALDSAASELRRDLDWIRFAEEALAEDSLAAVLAASASELSRNVYPICLLLERIGSHEVRLNIFDPIVHRRMRALNWLCPHFHQHDFVSRILVGGYKEAVFFNDGTFQDPRLLERGEFVHQSGDMVIVPFDAYHDVLEVAPATITLIVRTNQRYFSEESIWPPRDLDRVADLARQARGVLATSVGYSQGDTVDLRSLMDDLPRDD